MDGGRTSFETNNTDINNLLFDEWADFENGINNSKNHPSDINNSNATNFNTNDNLDISALCCDEEFIGFDKNSGTTWIYPTNYPVRDYQYNIVKAALFKNTLVSLPTGLGKTFIAAVIMYNFYRWYPLGKIIFTAPTRPLVAQQIEACYNIMAIPPNDTVEMTGSMPTAARKVAWQQKRVFFATPQVIQNDLESGSCPGELVRCLVIDEAHRARGRHSYCLVVEALALKQHRLFRVLGLSATPGSKVEDVISVVNNLQIAHLELRTEQCIDVSMYSHSRSMQTVVIPLGEELSAIRQQYIEILDIYTRRLVQYKVLMGNIGGLSKGRVLMLFKEYSNREKTQRHPHHQHIMRDFTMVITLYHALELLTKHGSRVFLNFFDEHNDKAWVGKDDKLTNFFERLRDDLGTNPFSIDRSILPDGSIPEIKEELKYGHPKFDHLRMIIEEHFNEAGKKGQETKAIVFCEYRESVNLVHCLLLQLRPAVKPHMFIGQGFAKSGGSNEMKAFTQKQQLRVMKMFREGTCNVLVSTCVGEEGLDVGSVDLIVCFDISNKSPIRLVQRCGRTGRERGGRVVILVTEGREHQTLKDCILQRDSLNRRVLQSKELSKNLYSLNPRMFPKNVTPECLKIFITVKKKIDEKQSKPQKVQKKLRDIHKKRSFGLENDEHSVLDVFYQKARLSKQDFTGMYPEGIPAFEFFEDSYEHWHLPQVLNMNLNSEISSGNSKKIKLSSWTEWQRKLQYTIKFGHSSDSEVLSELLTYADQKRFNESFESQKIEITSQVPENTTNATIFKVPNKIKELTKKKDKPTFTPIQMKNHDIRALFQKLKENNNDEEALFSAKLKETLTDCGIECNDRQNVGAVLQKDNIPPVFIDLMVELNIQKTKNSRTISHSKYENTIFNESHNFYKGIKPSGLATGWSLPSNSLLEKLIFLKKKKNSVFFSPAEFENKAHSKVEVPVSNKSTSICEKSFQNNIKSIEGETYISSSISCIKSSNVLNEIILNEECKNADFDIGDIDDLFGDSTSPMNIPSSSPKPTQDNQAEVHIRVEIKPADNPLQLYDLDLVEDIFAEDLSEDMFASSSEPDEHAYEKTAIATVENEPKGKGSQSPILLSQKPKQSSKLKLDISIRSNKNISTDNCSSFLHTELTRIRRNSNDIKRNEQVNENLNKPKKCSLKNNHSVKNSNSEDENMINKNDITSLFSVTQILDIINNDSSIKGITTPTHCTSVQQFNDKSTRNEIKNKNCHEEGIIVDGDSDKSSDSIILCSQIKPKVKCHKKLSYKHNITIFESSESSYNESSDSDKVISIPTKLGALSRVNRLSVKNNNSAIFQCKSPKALLNLNRTMKRKLNSSDDSNELSPFFKKPSTAQPSVLNEKLPNTVSLQQKLNQSFENCSSNIQYVADQKENPPLQNINNKLGNLSESWDQKYKNINHVSQSVFAKTTQPQQWLRKKTNGFDKSEKSKCDVKFLESDSDDDFVDPTHISKTVYPNISRKQNPVFKKKRKVKPRSEFIDYEAILSDDSYEETSGDGTKNSDDLNTSIAEFLCDEEQIEADDNIDMEAKYLQSVRSPVKIVGKFKIPTLPMKNPSNIFSQVDNPDHTHYELDSFCVDVDDVNITQHLEMSELEIAEAILKKRKRRQRYNSNDSEEEIFSIAKADNPAGDSPIAHNKKKRVHMKLESESSTDEGETPCDIFLNYQ